MNYKEKSISDQYCGSTIRNIGHIHKNYNFAFSLDVTKIFVWPLYRVAYPKYWSQSQNLGHGHIQRKNHLILLYQHNVTHISGVTNILGGSPKIVVTVTKYESQSQCYLVTILFVWPSLNDFLLLEFLRIFSGILNCDQLFCDCDQ